MDDSKRQMIQSLLRELMNDATTVDVPVFGYSMYPFLKPGVKVRVEQPLFSEVRRGDVVLFQSGDRLVLHRVVRLECEKLWCRGDSLLRFDNPVDNSCLVGIITHWFDNGRWHGVDDFRFRFFRAMILKAYPLSSLLFRVLVLITLKFGSTK